jgi:hypothetical protein
MTGWLWIRPLRSRDKTLHAVKGAEGDSWVTACGVYKSSKANSVVTPSDARSLTDACLKCLTGREVAPAARYVGPGEMYENEWEWLARRERYWARAANGRTHRVIARRIAGEAPRPEGRRRALTYCDLEFLSDLNQRVAIPGSEACLLCHGSGV